jgi:hypothetical protein
VQQSVREAAHSEKQSMCNIFPYLGAESSGHMLVDHVLLPCTSAVACPKLVGNSVMMYIWESTEFPVDVGAREIFFTMIT